MIDQTQLKAFKELVETKESFAIFIHQRPDLDAITSGLLIRDYLLSKGKRVKVYAPHELSDFNKIVKGHEHIELMDGNNLEQDFEVYVFCDMPSSSRGVREGELYIPEGITAVKIDHHSYNEIFADINVHDYMSSCTEVIYHLFEYLGYEIDAETARTVLIGIVDDTRWLKLASLKPSTFMVMSELLKIYPKLNLLYQDVYANYKKGYIPLFEYMMSNLVEDSDSSLLYCVLPLDLTTSLEIESPDIAVAKRDFLDEIMGRFGQFDAHMVLSEKQDGKYSGSIRSYGERVDCQKVCGLLGGGGHKTGSGFESKKDIEEILDIIRQGIQEFHS